MTSEDLAMYIKYMKNAAGWQWYTDMALATGIDLNVLKGYAEGKRLLGEESEQVVERIRSAVKAEMKRKRSK